jgi:plasmid maintenance system antidote protein VapI
MRPVAARERAARLKLDRVEAELDPLNMSAATLARGLNVPTNRVTEILNGQRAITRQESGEPVD